MKKLLILLAALGGILLFSGSESKGWKTVDGVIVFDTPAREPGQKSVLGLKTAPMETVRVGFIGLGMRFIRISAITTVITSPTTINASATRIVLSIV